MEIRRRQTNHNNLLSSSSSCLGDQIRKSSQRIKLAAYTSMAYAVGPRKAWARALLWKLKNRSSNRRRFVVRKTSLLGVKKKKKKRVHVNKVNYQPKGYERENNFVEKTEKLRELVPGGKAMDICSLFEETAHFVKSLAMQVQVMQDISDQLSR